MSGTSQAIEYRFRTDVRCTSLNEKGELCDHLIMRHWQIVCPGCKREYSLADLIRQGRANRLSVDNLLQEAFSLPLFDRQREIQQANGWAQRILRPLRKKVTTMSCPYSEELVINQLRDRYELFRIPEGISIAEIGRASIFLGVSPLLRTDATRGLEVSSEQKTEDAFVFFKPEPIAWSQASATWGSVEAVANAVESDRNLGKELKLAVPRLADLLFALLTTRLKESPVNDSSEWWIRNILVRVTDKAGEEWFGVVSQQSTKRVLVARAIPREFDDVDTPKLPVKTCVWVVST